jgi:uncharacterized protein YkwD
MPMRRLLIILITIIGGFAGQEAQAAGTCLAPANINDLATQIATGLNANRQSNSLGRLTFNSELSQAAMSHACDMSLNNYVDHRGTDGSNSQDRARQMGYNDCLIAENLAWGYPDPAQIVSGWMTSPHHRSNMLLANVHDFGVGIVDSARGPIWVLVLARSC